MKFDYDGARVDGCVCGSRGPGHAFCGVTTHAPAAPTREIADRRRSYARVPLRRGIADRPLVATMPRRTRFLVMAAGALATARIAWRVSFATDDMDARRAARAVAVERTRMAATLRAEAKRDEDAVPFA